MGERAVFRLLTLEVSAISEMMNISHKSSSKTVGATPTPTVRTGYHNRCQSGLENSFKAVHLAPTRFWGQFSRSTDNAEASKHHHRVSVHPALRKVRSRLQRTSLIQKREKLPNISDTDEDQRAFVLPRPTETTDDNKGANKQWLLFCILFF